MKFSYLNKADRKDLHSVIRVLDVARIHMQRVDKITADELAHAASVLEDMTSAFEQEDAFDLDAKLTSEYGPSEDGVPCNYCMEVVV